MEVLLNLREEVDESIKMKMIEIDPGTAFGTGKHDTQHSFVLSEVLWRYMSRMVTRFLILGCGSGILSIVAKKLNASKVDMTDIDPVTAIEAAYDTLKVNNLSMDNVKVEAGNVSGR
ncbi:MAG: 50S ribosomal protein L11 methyltransferase [Eubacterium ventriosum]